jgi:hypothetical protein
LLVRIEKTFGRLKLENLDAIGYAPTVRRGPAQQLLLGLRQRDVERPLPGARAFEQETQGDRGLAGSRRTFEQE